MSDLEDFDLPSQKQAKDAFKGGGVGEQVVSSSEEEQTRVEDQKPSVSNDEEKKSLFQLFRYNAREISKSPRDLLVVYIAVFLDALSYYMFSYALIMHLGLEVGLTDANSGLFYGLFGVCITLATLVLGFVMDKIGIRLSVCISSITALATRMGMAYAVLARSWLLTAIILFLGVGPSMALMGPALPVAIKRQSTPLPFFLTCANTSVKKRYTTSRTKDFAFSINYGVMNLAAFIATPIVDMIRLHAQNDVLLLPPYALLIAGTALLQIPVFVAAAFGMRDIDLQEDGVTIIHRASIILSEEDVSSKPSAWTTVKIMLYNRKFWVAVTVALSLVGVKSSFRYFDALYLPYVTRAYDDAETFPYMTLLALNPAIVIPLTLTGLITLMTSKGHPIKWILIGSLIGGIAPVFMMIGPYIASIVLYVVFTSIGEIIWSPITYSYVLSLADTGDEGAWMAVAGMTFFLPKILTGVLTGQLLQKFCPPLVPTINGTSAIVERVFATVTTTTMARSTIPGTPAPAQLGGNPETCWSLVIWGIITLTTISSFFMLLIFRKFVTVQIAVTTKEVPVSTTGINGGGGRLVLTQDNETQMIPMSDIEE